MTGVSEAQFAPLQDALSAIVDADGGWGAGVSVVVGGRVVADFVDGYADGVRRRRFAGNALVPVFSTGKTVIGVMMARLIGRGDLSLGQRVADFWPDFAQGGKQDITVAELLGHRAGLAALPGLDEPETWYDREAIVARLAAMSPLWEDRGAAGYHAVTFGHLADELHRRATGIGLGEAFRTRIAEPHALDLWLGLPAAEQHRVAETNMDGATTDFGPGTALRQQVFLSPGSSPAGRSIEEWRAACLPAVNAHGTARGFARLMGALADDGRLDGVDIVAPHAIPHVSAESSLGDDLVLPHRISWGAGFIRNSGFGAYGPSPNAFGHSGWGGSCAFADPENRLGFAFVPTRHTGTLIDDPRARRLVEVAYACL